MFTKRHRITLLFNANKAYDRQVVEGVGEYLQASQSEWDIFIEEDFRARIDKIKDWLGDGVIADFDDKQIEQALADVDVPIVGVGGSYHLAESYPPVHYIATDNYALVESAFLHLKEKGVNRFAFYGLPESSGKRWATEREYAFRQLVAEEQKCILESIQQLKVKTSSPDLAIGRLSGGNQQKAILARCLLLNPRILILDEPTRGIDIGAKYEIYKLINQLVQQGIAVIVISSELPEVLGLSDRVLVMHEGKLKANLINHNLTQEQVMEAALRSEHHVEKQSV